jgi:uncharacterized damage-inducible protein DinB
MTRTIADLFLKEIETEAPATRKCVERVPVELFNYKPHDRSMGMGGLVVMMVDMLKWIAVMVETGEINFTTWERIGEKEWGAFPELFDRNLERVKKIFEGSTDEELNSKTFTLKNGDQVLMTGPLVESISSTLNHWVHHRGQLTVYMRLNEIKVPSLYGPSADESHF